MKVGASGSKDDSYKPTFSWAVNVLALSGSASLTSRMVFPSDCVLSVSDESGFKIVYFIGN